MGEKREQWGSRFGFLMAAAGSAIGLGNIWRFPYVTGKFGGAAFLAFYLLIVFTVGISITIAEWAIGRAGKSDSVGSFRRLGGGFWTIVGWFGFISALVILSYYSVIAGWIIYYVKFAFSGLIGSIQTSASEDVFFMALIKSPKLCIALHLINMLLVVGITIKGISSGIEKICKILMPGLFVILLVLVARSLTLAGSIEGVKFYLIPDFSKLGIDGMLAAAGQAFFSLSLAMGIAITYGSYLGKDEKITGLARTVVELDTLVAFLAGLVIFPACIATGIVPNAGAGLTFITLPRVFTQMPFGKVFELAFFLLFFIAAITSAIALFEVVVAYGIDQLKMNRKVSSIVMGIVVFALGTPSALAETPLVPKIFGKGFLDAVDFVINNWLMPVTAIFICIFVGWFWSKGAKDEVTNEGKIPFKLYPVWLFICRFVAPILLTVLLISGGKW
ncbi:MAG: sodium-dependent transporter [Synergistaceae bacterium]|nr:sodium-dependent transporter [Synergistaceae bacterium]